MFTGIIEEVGKIASTAAGKLTVSASLVIQGMELGASLAINGVCLTVTNFTPTAFSVEIMPETLNRTNLGHLSTGNKVNLERPLTLNKQIGGHFVQGHVDGTGKVVSLIRESGTTRLKIEAPSSVMRYLVEKGFVAVDGISLTVTERESTSFVVSIVEYTRQHTILSEIRIGDIVNLEVDIIAKYVERLKQGSNQETMLAFLEEHDLSKMR